MDNVCKIYQKSEFEEYSNIACFQDNNSFGYNLYSKYIFFIFVLFELFTYVAEIKSTQVGDHFRLYS